MHLPPKLPTKLITDHYEYLVLVRLQFKAWRMTDPRSLHDLGDDLLREVFSFSTRKALLTTVKCAHDGSALVMTTTIPGCLCTSLDLVLTRKTLNLGAASTLPWKKLFMQRCKEEKAIEFEYN